MSEHSRRTVVRGAAWSVPLIAVAAQAPAFAASLLPPPPGIRFDLACANTGATNKGCGVAKALQVPLTVSNPTTRAIVFQITSMFTSNGTTAPTAAGPGVAEGVSRIAGTTAGFANQSTCTAVTTSACTGGVDNGSVVVAAGTTGTFFIVAAPTGTSAAFSSTINFRLLDAVTCAVLSVGTAQTAAAISPANCD